jgi:WD40 repeat protein/mono/diheme cytochrome c family protein
MRSLLCLPTLLLAAPLFAADPKKEPAGAPKKVSYYNDVRPIFQQHCQGCHQPAKAGGGYVMTAYPDLLKKGEREKPGVVPGKPEQSFLVELMRPLNGKAEMPRGKDPLPDHQIKTVVDWIVQGAADDTPASAKAALIDEEHPPVYTALPVVTGLAFSPDGQYLAVSGYHEVLLHKADGSGLVARFVGLSERVQSLAFSPDGKTLAVSGGDPGRFGEIQLWDVEKRKLRLSVPVTYDTVYGVSWSPDGKLVAFGCADNTTRAIEADTGKQAVFLGAHSDWVMGTAFAGDGQHLVSVSRDRSVKMTEVATNRFVDNVTSITPGALKGGLLAVAVRPTRWAEELRALALVGVSAQRGRPTEVFNLQGYTAPRKNLRPRDIPDVPVKNYDEILVSGADGQPRLYKMHREVKRVIGDDSNFLRAYEKMPGRVYALAFDPSGAMFAAGSSLDGAGEARVYQTDNAKKVSTFENLKTPVYALAFRPDGKAVASAGFDGTVRLHDPLTGKLIREFVPVPMGK